MIFKGHFVEEQFVEFTEFSVQTLIPPNPTQLGDVTIWWYDHTSSIVQYCTFQEYLNFSQEIQDLKHPEKDEA
jgi:hypothetical protein